MGDTALMDHVEQRKGGQQISDEQLNVLGRLLQQQLQRQLEEQQMLLQARMLASSAQWPLCVDTAPAERERKQLLELLTKHDQLKEKRMDGTEALLAAAARLSPVKSSDHRQMVFPASAVKLHPTSTKEDLAAATSLLAAAGQRPKDLASPGNAPTGMPSVDKKLSPKDPPAPKKREREASDDSGTSRRSTKRAKSGKPARNTGRICQAADCSKLARSSTQFCAAHGGGRRCQAANCDKSARGATPFCIAHGGGRRCSMDGCTKSAQGSTSLCIAHGGGRRCKFFNCPKSARGPTGFCKAHGGGKRCAESGCGRCVSDGSRFCKTHATTEASAPAPPAPAAPPAPSAPSAKAEASC